MAAFAVERHFEDVLYNIGFLRNNHHLAVLILVAIRRVADDEGSFLKSVLNAPLAVFRNGSGLALRNGAQDGKHQLRTHVLCIDVLLFKIDGNVQPHQLSNHLQALHCVSGKPADGLGDDSINFSVLTVLQ